MAPDLMSDPKFTLEYVEKSVMKAKKILHWTQGWVLTSIQVGISPEKVEFDKRIMRQHSTYFSNFSLPTTAYAEQFTSTTDRLLHLNKEEVKIFDWIIGWCHQPVDDGAQLYEENDGFTMDRWCHLWSLTCALHMPELRELTLEAVRHKCDREEMSPPHTSVQYLYDLQHHHDIDKDSLWNEFVAQHCIVSEKSLNEATEHLFVQAFVDDVVIARKILLLRDRDLDVAGDEGSLEVKAV
jgi:hypothetical protein